MTDHQCELTGPSGACPFTENVNRGGLIGDDIDVVECRFALDYQAIGVGYLRKTSDLAFGSPEKAQAFGFNEPPPAGYSTKGLN